MTVSALMWTPLRRGVSAASADLRLFHYLLSSGHWKCFGDAFALSALRQKKTNRSAFHRLQYRPSVCITRGWKKEGRKKNQKKPRNVPLTSQFTSEGVRQTGVGDDLVPGFVASLVVN